MRIFQVIYTWLLVAGIASSSPVWAKSVCPDQPIHIAFYDLGVLYNPKTGLGLDKDVIDEIFYRLQCPYVPEFQSRVRIWNMLADHQLDMSVSGIPNAEREKFAEFVPYFYVRNQLVYLDRNLDVRSPQTALNNPAMVLGVVKSYKHGAGWDDWIEAMRRTHRIEEVPDTRSLVSQLKGGRIQAFPALPAVIMDLGVRYDLDPATVKVTQWFADQPKIEHGLILNKTRMSADLRQAIAKVMQQMRNDGTLLKIYLKYFDEREAKAMLLPS